MKVTRLVIGIISFVMALIVTFQSCFAGLGNAMEDNGEGISFHIFAYNNQPGISINYRTGDSTLSESSGTMTDQQEYVMNTASMKFHLPSCSSVSTIKEENKATYQGPREDLIAEGYEPCGRCNP